MTDESERATREHLFWTVYQLEKGLAFRLGRSSNIRDEEITLPFDVTDKSVRITRTQGRVYDQLYSPTGLCRPDEERREMATKLATELHNLISETHNDVSVRFLVLLCLPITAQITEWCQLSNRLPLVSLPTRSRTLGDAFSCTAIWYASILY
jgi:hypothetical protein